MNAKTYGIGEREIKFRAWPKFERYEDEEDYREYAEMIYTEDADLKRGCGFVAPSDDAGPNEEYYWMQYTGLYDEDGDEICEGDIVQIYESSAVIKYDNSSQGGGRFYPEFSDEYEEAADIWDDKERWYKAKILGNIFENPELINKTT